MAFRKRVKLPDPTILIDIEGGDYDGIQIRARRRVPLREVFRYRRLLQSREKDEEGNVVYNEETARDWADTYLIDWNINDEQDNPIPVGGDAFVDLLPEDLTNTIIGMWTAMLTGPDPNSEAPSNDGATSEELQTNEEAS